MASSRSKLPSASPENHEPKTERYKAICKKKAQNVFDLNRWSRGEKFSLTPTYRVDDGGGDGGLKSASRDDPRRQPRRAACRPRDRSSTVFRPDFESFDRRDVAPPS